MTLETGTALEAPTAAVPAVWREPMPLDQFRQLGWWLSLAELDIDTPECRGAAAALRFAMANMLGVSPTAALTELSFIHGRLNLSAQLVRALALKAGYKVQRADSTDETCTAVLVDAATGEELGRTTYTIEDARRAGLIRQGGGYTKSPGRMLWARASKRVVDDFAPEVSLGITTPEEEYEISGGAAPPREPAGDDPTPVAAGADAATEAGEPPAAGTVAATDTPVSVDAPPDAETGGAATDADAQIPVFPDDDLPDASDLSADG